METRLKVLKLALDALGVPIDIDTMDDRKRIQKAVYLGQLGGFDLGYRFGWYKKGPYSPGLTRDYFALAHALATEDDNADQHLAPVYVTALKSTLPLTEKPDAFPLTDEDWLELVASLHYLMVVRRLPYKAAVKELTHRKPHLAEHAELARQKVEATGFMPKGEAAVHA
jgi:hypothetical protein